MIDEYGQDFINKLQYKNNVIENFNSQEENKITESMPPRST